MNTHDIELPKPFMTVYDDVDKVEVGCYSEIQVRAAIEADRQARGEPVAWMTEDGRVATSETKETSMPRVAQESFKIPLYTAPQPQQTIGDPVAWYTDDHLTDKSATTWDKTVAERWKGRGWPVFPLYTTPQPQQIPEGYKLVPIDPTAQNIEGEGIVETVTKAILFEDCGSTEDWQDNLNLGEAAIRAMVAHIPVEMGASEWAELHILRAERGPSDGGHKTWKDAAIAERCNRVLMAPRKEIVDLAKEGLIVYTGPNMNEHKLCAEIVRLSTMLEAAPEPKEKP